MGAGEPGPANSALAWQLEATDAAGVVPSAPSVTVAVIDTGADVDSPAFAGRRIAAFNVHGTSTTAGDANGHGTFVASLASAWGAPLLVVAAADASGSISAQNEARAIRYAVDHGARVINLSIAGTTTSQVERAAVRYAVSHGALLVAAAGNDYLRGNPVEYPAALLQPVGSNGRGGAGLVVAASQRDGSRAEFSNIGSWISLAAPGKDVFAALSRNAPASSYPRMPLVGATAPVGFASGTSFAAPQVAAAAALVWGADPALSREQVAQVLEETSSGHGTWTPALGYGVIDVAAALARAQQLASGA